MVPGWTYDISGTQLNGLSQACSYGDDAQMATNYPIVRLTSTLSGVFYARTFNFSTMAVATGNSLQNAKAKMPLDMRLDNGQYNLVVIANGIASDPVTIDILGPRPIMFQNLDNKNFELVVPEATQQGNQLHHYFFTYGDGSNKWKSGPIFGSNVTGNPVMFQNFDNKNFELVVPEATQQGNQLHHYFFTYGGVPTSIPRLTWNSSAIFGSNVIEHPVMFQNFDNKNFELVVLQTISKGSQGSQLHHYFFTYGGVPTSIPRLGIVVQFLDQTLLSIQLCFKTLIIRILN
jgi:hypothetical protein